jgi:hypothetical protein
MNTFIAIAAVLCLVPLLAVLFSACALSSQISQIEEQQTEGGDAQPTP